MTSFNTIQQRIRTLWATCLTALLFALLLPSCKEDNFGGAPVRVQISFLADTADRWKLTELDTLRVVAKNVVTDSIVETVSVHGEAVEMQLPEGVYDFTARGRVTAERYIYHYAANAEDQRVRAEGRGKSAALQVNMEVKRSVLANPKFMPKEVLVPLVCRLKLPAVYSMESLAGAEVNVDMADKGNYKFVVAADGLASFELPEGHAVVNAKFTLPSKSVGDEDLAFFAQTQLDIADENPPDDVILRLQKVIKPGGGDGYIALRLQYATAPEADAQQLLQLTLTSPLSGTTQTFAVKPEEGVAKLQLPFGSYSLTGSLEILRPGGISVEIYPSISASIAHESDGNEFALELGSPTVNSALVFKEVYFTSSLDNNGKPGYDADRYVELYNNSPFTIYVDQVAFCATFKNTMLKKGGFFPKLKPENGVIPGFIFSIPGSGKEHPLAPGATLLICDQGLNHHAINPQYCPIDMSRADWEWKDEDWHDIDVPEVPNLEKWFSYSKTITVLHNRGYWAFYIMKPDAPMKEFLDRYFISTTFPNGSTAEVYNVPPRYILDCVQCAAPRGPVAKVVPANVDAGYTYCDGAFIAKCVRRKVAAVINGRIVLQDTNNSTNDFIPNAEPSPREFPKEELPK